MPNETEQIPTAELSTAELDAVYEQQQKTEQELAAKAEQERQLREEIAETKLKDTFSEARKASGYAFYLSTPDLIKLVKSEPGFTVNTVDGSFFVDGKRVELTEMLGTFAARHKWSREVTAAERAAYRGQKEQGVRSKADLKTTADKVAFVSKFGADAYAALPAHAPIDENKIQYLTLEEFSKLPVKVKSAFVAKHGQQAVSNLRFNKR